MHYISKKCVFIVGGTLILTRVEEKNTKMKKNAQEKHRSLHTESIKAPSIELRAKQLKLI